MGAEVQERPALYQRAPARLWGSGDEVAGSVGKTSFWHLNQEKQPGWNRREAG